MSVTGFTLDWVVTSWRSPKEKSGAKETFELLQQTALRQKQGIALRLNSHVRFQDHLRSNGPGVHGDGNGTGARPGQGRVGRQVTVVG